MLPRVPIAANSTRPKFGKSVEAAPIEFIIRGERWRLEIIDHIADENGQPQQMHALSRPRVLYMTVPPDPDDFHRNLGVAIVSIWEVMNDLDLKGGVL